MNYPAALCDIGWLYNRGSGVVRDDALAFKYMLRSAQLGYPRAQNNLAFYYKKGTGTTVNLREALRWFRSAEASKYSKLARSTYEEVKRAVEEMDALQAASADPSSAPVAVASDPSSADGRVVAGAGSLPPVASSVMDDRSMQSAHFPPVAGAAALAILGLNPNSAPPLGAGAVPGSGLAPAPMAATAPPAGGQLAVVGTAERRARLIQEEKQRAREMQQDQLQRKLSANAAAGAAEAKLLAAAHMGDDPSPATHVPVIAGEDGGVQHGGAAAAAAGAGAGAGGGSPSASVANGGGPVAGASSVMAASQGAVGAAQARSAAAGSVPDMSPVRGQLVGPLAGLREAEGCDGRLYVVPSVAVSTKDTDEPLYAEGLDHFKKKDYEAAFAVWSRLVNDKSHPGALCDLGFLCNEGFGTPLNPQKVRRSLAWRALACLRPAYPYCQPRLGARGTAHLFSPLSTPSPLHRQAFIYHLMSAALGYPRAMGNLAIFYKRATGCAADNSKALLWLEAAEDLKARGIPAKTLDQLRRMRDQGDASIMQAPSEEARRETAQNEYNAGLRLHKHNPRASLVCWLLSAANGYEAALCDVGWLYGEVLAVEFTAGQGGAVGGAHMKPHQRLAFYFMEQAALRGYPRAQNNLGLYYRKGLGREPDMRQALYWLQRAKDAKYAKLAETTLVEVRAIVQKEDDAKVEPAAPAAAAPVPAAGVGAGAGAGADAGVGAGAGAAGVGAAAGAYGAARSVGMTPSKGSPRADARPAFGAQAGDKSAAATAAAAAAVGAAHPPPAASAPAFSAAESAAITAYQTMVEFVMQDPGEAWRQRVHLEAVRKRLGIRDDMHGAALRTLGVDANEFARAMLEPAPSPPPASSPPSAQSGRASRGSDDSGAAAPSADDLQGGFCVVCLAKRADHVVLDCFHLCLCGDCFGEFGSGRLCPVCRGKIARIKRVYLPS